MAIRRLSVRGFTTSTALTMTTIVVVIAHSGAHSLILVAELTLVLAPGKELASLAALVNLISIQSALCDPFWLASRLLPLQIPPYVLSVHTAFEPLFPSRPSLPPRPC